MFDLNNYLNQGSSHVFNRTFSKKSFKKNYSTDLYIHKT